MKRRDAVAFAMGLLAPIALRAQDTPQELLGFERRSPPPRRGHAVEPLEWERLRRGADSFGPPRLGDAERALLEAARVGRWSEVVDAVKKGRAYAGAQDEAGYYALELAAREGRDDAVRALLESGADPDRIAADGFTPLGAAAFFGHRSTVRIVLRGGASPNRWGITGQGPLHLACMTDQVEVIDELLGGGLDPWSRNRSGDTALDVAAQLGRQRAMSRLLAAGVDPSLSGR